MGKSSKITTGYHYKPAFHVGICRGPFDAYLEWRIADKTAFAGELTASGEIVIDQPKLFGGEKDQGGVEGTLEIMFGEATQMPNAYLAEVFGPQQPAWRGLGTMAWKGGRFGGNNPYPHKHASKIRKILQGWDGDWGSDPCWYSEKAETHGPGEGPLPASILVTGHAKSTGGPMFAVADSTASPVFTGIPQATGADFVGLPYSHDGMVAVVGNDRAIFCTRPFDEWVESDTTPTQLPHGITGGTAGWLAYHYGASALGNGFWHAPPTPVTWTNYFPGQAIWHVSFAAGYYWRSAPGQLFRSALPEGPWTVHSTGIYDWVDIVEHQGALYATCTDSGTWTIRRSTDGGATWPDILVSTPSVSHPPYFLCTVGDYLVAWCLYGGVWTDANSWAEWIDLGIGGSGDSGFASWQVTGGRKIASANGLAYVIGADDELVVFNPATLAVGAPITLPISVAQGIVALPAEPVPSGANIYMNPAHMLVYSRTDGERGREPFANINEASLLAAADRLYTEGFGLCTHYNPAEESPAEFEHRICRVIDGSFERSLTDGEWYLDLARGDYVLEDLPVLTDDDILEFQELPTTLDRAVNSLAVRYFDVQRKEQVVTPAVRDLGLIRAFGEIHETLDFPEIPNAALAMLVCEREARKRKTPTKAFKLVTTPVTYAWRGNQYFRLQSVKRRIADMVCIVGERETGTLVSGARRLNATQDIYSLPTTTYIDVEPSEDTGQAPPEVITVQRADEAPYIDLVARMPRAELEALPQEIGFAMAAAAQPTAGWDFTMYVAPDGGEYQEAGNGTWCPTATTAGLASRVATVVPLASHQGLADVALGSAAFWDDEIVRVDDKDVDAGTVTLGRGCADTVPAPHAAGSRLFFSDDHAAYDVTEYADGEEVDVKLLANRGAQQLDLALATALPITFDQRAYRPYPPADFQVNGNANPSYLFGELTASWSHRDRVLQADLLVDTTAADIGPEVGTTYTVRWYLDDVLEHTDSGETGTSVAYTPSGDGVVRVEAEAVRDGRSSWQMQLHSFPYTATESDPLQIFGSTVTIFGDPIYLE